MPDTFVAVEPEASEKQVVQQALKTMATDAEINRRATAMAKQIAQELFEEYKAKYHKDLENSIRMSLEHTNNMCRGGW